MDGAKRHICLSVAVIILIVTGGHVDALSKSYFTYGTDCYTSQQSTHERYRLTSVYDTAYVYGRYSSSTPKTCYMTFKGSNDIEVEFTDFQISGSGVTLNIYDSQYSYGTPTFVLNKYSSAPPSFTAKYDAVSIKLELSTLYSFLHSSNSYRFTIKIKRKADDSNSKSIFNTNQQSSHTNTVTNNNKIVIVGVSGGFSGLVGLIILCVILYCCCGVCS